MTKREPFDKTRLTDNPFAWSLVIPVTSVTSNGSKMALDKDSGIYLPDGYYMENIASTRIYRSTGCKDIIYNLSDKAQRLFLFISYNLDKNVDYIQINREAYKKKNGIKSGTTVIEAIKELVRYCIIAQTEYQSVYWVNPAIVFCGNRLTKFPYRKKVTQIWDSSGNDQISGAA